VQDTLLVVVVVLSPSSHIEQSLLKIFPPGSYTSLQLLLLMLLSAELVLRVWVVLSSSAQLVLVSLLRM